MKICVFCVELSSSDLQCIVVISMVDLIDSSLQGHPEKTFQSKRVQETVGKVSQATGFPLVFIFPLINYCHQETGKNQYIEKMVAMILIRALEQADGLFLRKFNEQRLKYDGMIPPPLIFSLYKFVFSYF
jgi:hypothetical protein